MNKLTVKDLITVGIFTAIYIVLFFQRQWWGIFHF